MARPSLLARIFRRTAKAAAWSIFAVSLLIGFGITGSSRLVRFREAVASWPAKDFRDITAEYSILGHAAMRSGLVGIPAGRVVMTLRSIPGLPPELAVNPTSALHYR